MGNGVRSTRYRTWGTEHRTRSTEHGAQNTEHRTQNTEHRARKPDETKYESSEGLVAYWYSPDDEHE